jgi:hypothetical protein
MPISEWSLVLVAVIVTLGVLVESRFRLAAIVREIRAEGRESRASLTTSVERVDMMEQALLQALRESLQGREAAAVQTIQQAEALPKPHRHQWVFASEEKTNGEHVKLHICGVGDCRDVLREAQ